MVPVAWCEGTSSFNTSGGIQVTRTVKLIPEENQVDEFRTLCKTLDDHRGCIFESAFEHPKRYVKRSVGFCNPPLVLESQSNGPTPCFKVSALNSRGELLLPFIFQALENSNSVDQGTLKLKKHIVEGAILKSTQTFTEEERSKQNTIFSVLRTLLRLFQVDTNTDSQLGLYGAFGYDLCFQFEPTDLVLKRSPNQRDLVLYIPDAFLINDKHLGKMWRIEYDFLSQDGKSDTKDLPRGGEITKRKINTSSYHKKDHQKGEFVETATKAHQEFQIGNLFECIISQCQYEACDLPYSELFERVRSRNPSPYMFLINLGEDEALIGASPAMFVRIGHGEKGIRVETCPISGTIKRGSNAIEDSDQIFELLSSLKEKSELTMCTDVDRNDKSRVCQPGSIRVIGRRQIETYSKLIHTVDHVEGYLRNGYDAVDAFLAHTWMVTVTGCPKQWAVQFIEQNEKTPREWYGGCHGSIHFDGTVDTGLTLSTIRVKAGIAQARAGSTNLFDSTPENEEAETMLKMSAFMEAILYETIPNEKESTSAFSSAGEGNKVVLIDHQDSFVNTLASYYRQTGAEVTTIRYGIEKTKLQTLQPDLVVLSPGPGKPSDFLCHETLKMLQQMNVPVFGVCLGLQAMVEYFGGSLNVLDYPVHGKPGDIRCAKDSSWGIMEKGIPKEVTVARYHSLYANEADFPEELRVTAETTEDPKVIMAIEHKSLPFAAVQFHPESILTSQKVGLQILVNSMKLLK